MPRMGRDFLGSVMSISIACQHTHHDISFEDFVKVEIAEMVTAILRDNGYPIGLFERGIRWQIKSLGLLPQLLRMRGL